MNDKHIRVVTPEYISKTLWFGVLQDIKAFELWSSLPAEAAEIFETTSPLKGNIRLERGPVQLKEIIDTDEEEEFSDIESVNSHGSRIQSSSDDELQEESSDGQFEVSPLKVSPRSLCRP